MGVHHKHKPSLERNFYGVHKVWSFDPMKLTRLLSIRLLSIRGRVLSSYRSDGP